MTWRARARKLILWSAASISVVLAVMWIGSLWWFLDWGAGGSCNICIRAGQLWVMPMAGDYTRSFQFQFRPYPSKPNMEWGLVWDSPGGRKIIKIPLWAPLTLSTAITAFAWRKEAIARKRASQYKCPACGYDKTGLATATPCPECGKTSQTT